jgi:AmpE protein
MTLITLLIVLTIERVSATLDIWQFPFYYQKMKDMAFKHMGQPSWFDNSIARWLWILLPVIVIQFLSGAMNWLLLEFAFNIAVLLICIGCVKERKIYKSFLNAFKRGDKEASELYKAQLCGIETEAPPMATSDVKQTQTDESQTAPHTDAQADLQTDESAQTAEQNEEKSTAQKASEVEVSLGQTLVWLNFRFYCAILFWFVCLGAGGAVLYCMIRETADDKDQKMIHLLPQAQLKKLLHIMDWLPARVCSAGYLLIGHFSQATGVWISYLLDFSSPAKTLICDIAQAAEPTHETYCGRAEESACMLKLAKRNVLFFLALVALLTLYGGIR